MTLSSLLLVLPLLLASCASGRDASAPLVSRSRYLMGTACTLSVPSSVDVDGAADAAFGEIARIERLVSTWRSDSDLSRLNAAPAGRALAVSGEVIDLLDRATALSRDTGGAFSPLAGRLIAMWDLRGEGRVPPEDEVRGAAAAIAGGGLRLDRERRTAARLGDVAVEEGGFAKGYALDRAIEELRERGVPSAILDFGGQVALFGFRKAVEIDIAHPEDRQRSAVRLAVKSGSVATSSGSEKYFEKMGERFSHIVDPRSGRALPPAGSATAIHQEALVADALSTALYVLGPREGLALADREGFAEIWLVPEQDGSYRVVRSAAASALPLEIHENLKTWKKEWQ
ncbi:MAG TPA: FAD:protein FMN transferase [Thermoanaerobaculia bacterium]|nr:FAD:protein FMN transferase [Thermoanaerobaculia bacterium]